MKLITVSIIILSFSVMAQPRGTNYTSGGGIGFGVIFSGAHDEDPAGHLAAHISVRRLMQVHTYYNRYRQDLTAPLLIIEGDVQYNAIGRSRSGLTTGAELRGRALVGGQFHGPSENGCDVYVAASIRADGRLNLQSPGRDYLYGSLGPETGLMCETGNVLILISPTVRINFAMLGTVRRDLGGGQVRALSELFEFGGVVRLVVDEDVYMSLEAGVIPDVGIIGEAGDAVRASYTLTIHLGDDWDWNLGAEVHYFDVPGPGDNVLDIRGQTSIIRNF